MQRAFERGGPSCQENGAVIAGEPQSRHKSRIALSWASLSVDREGIFAMGVDVRQSYKEGAVGSEIQGENSDRTDCREHVCPQFLRTKLTKFALIVDEMAWSFGF